MKFLLGFITILMIVTGVFSCKKADAKAKIVSPKANDVWIEGKTYTIRWKGFKEGVICISVLIGGHYAGIINSCDSCAAQNKYRWTIPVGFVSGFGEDRDDAVRVVLYYKDNKSNPYFSDYFTISK